MKIPNKNFSLAFLVGASLAAAFILFLNIRLPGTESSYSVDNGTRHWAHAIFRPTAGWPIAFNIYESSWSQCLVAIVCDFTILALFSVLAGIAFSFLAKKWCSGPADCEV